MKRLATPAGITLSYEVSGSGPPLVLVHGSFDDHSTNWVEVKRFLDDRFALHAVARRGRGETDATEGHGVADEGADIAALIEALDSPVFLLGHSYGAQVALAAAARVPDRVGRLILYEPPLPGTVSPDGLARLEALAAAGDWDGFATAFFHDELGVPREELEALREAGVWSEIVADARASLGDIRAMTAYDFDPRRFADLRLPVLLQVGSESPRQLFATDALAGALPDARIEELPGQAHEAMHKAPDLYARSVLAFLQP